MKMNQIVSPDCKQFPRETDKIVSYAQRNFTKLVKFGFCADVNFLLRLACNENAVYRGRQKLC